MTNSQLDELREQHKPYFSKRSGRWICAKCDIPSPCTVLCLLDHITAFETVTDESTLKIMLDKLMPAQWALTPHFARELHSILLIEVDVADRNISKKRPRGRG